MDYLCSYDIGLEKHILAQIDEITEQTNSSSSSENTSSTPVISSQQPLMPVPAPIQTRSKAETMSGTSSMITCLETRENEVNLVRKSLDYREFEHGLAPPDPWDTPKTMQDELRELYGSFMDPQTFTSSLHSPKKQGSS